MRGGVTPLSTQYVVYFESDCSAFLFPGTIIAFDSGQRGGERRKKRAEVIFSLRCFMDFESRAERPS